MKTTYDKKADAMYIYFQEIKPKGVKQTIGLNDDFIIDFDENKKILGIEILNASKYLEKKELQTSKALA